MNINYFFIKDNKIGLNTHKVTVRHYKSVDSKEKLDDTVYYVNAEGLNELEVNFVPKHKLLEIVGKEEINTSEYAWMEGIEIDAEADAAKQIERIASYGSIEAYKASLPETDDAFKLDIDYRLSKLELGI